MKLTFLPSLKHSANVTVAAALWNHKDARDLLLDFDTQSSLMLDGNMKDWEVIENKIFENIRTLMIPEKLKRELEKFIRPLGFQIFAWMKYVFHVLQLPRIFPSKLVWKTNGVFDSESIARIFLQDKVLNNYDSFKLSQHYCPNDNVNYYRGILEKNEESFMSHIINFVKKVIPSDQKIPTLNTRDFIIHGNEAGIKNYIQIMNEEENYNFIIDCTRNLLEKQFASHSGIILSPSKDQLINSLIFLLSKLKEDDLSFYVKELGYTILISFLDWPYQDLLLENAKLFWSEYDFCHDDFDKLLLRIVDKILQGYRDYDYFELFKNLWRESPFACKKEIVDSFLQDCAEPLLQDFFAFVREENIVTKVNDLIDDKKFICSKKNREKFTWHINEIAIFHFFLLGCLYPEDLMINYVKDYKERFYRWNISEEEEEILDEFFEVLDEFFGIKKENLDNFKIRKYKVKVSGEYRYESKLPGC